MLRRAQMVQTFHMTYSVMYAIEHSYLDMWELYYNKKIKPDIGTGVKRCITMKQRDKPAS